MRESLDHSAATPALSAQARPSNDAQGTEQAAPSGVAVQACRPEDRAMLASPAGRELLVAAVSALLRDAKPGEPVPIPADLAAAIQADLIARTAPEIERIRRAQRRAYADATSIIVD